MTGSQTIHLSIIKQNRRALVLKSIQNEFQKGFGRLLVKNNYNSYNFNPLCSVPLPDAPNPVSVCTSSSFSRLLLFSTHVFSILYPHFKMPRTTFFKPSESHYLFWYFMQVTAVFKAKIFYTKCFLSNVGKRQSWILLKIASL